jgi:hypothetical protein
VDARRAAALAHRRARAAPAGLALFVGRADATAFIVPCILSALTDYEHVVIEHALNVLASLCELALLAKDLMLDVLRRQGMNMVVHPSLGVRAAALSGPSSSPPTSCSSRRRRSSRSCGRRCRAPSSTS